MPKRTNPFQHLIVLLEASLARDGAVVTESKELLDPQGHNREVDIVIELRDPVHPLTIGVECTAQERKATVEWVEQMWAKHQGLPTNQLVLVSRAGFTKPAKEKAEAIGIRALSLKQAEELDWQSVVHRTPEVTLVSFRRPVPTGVTVVFGLADNESEFDSSLVDVQNCVLYYAPGESRKATEVVDSWLRNAKILQEIQQRAYSDSGTLIDLEVRLRRGTYTLDRTGTKRPVVAIQVQAKCNKQVNVVPLEKGAYGPVAIATGESKSFGHPTQFLLMQEPGAEPKLIVSIAKPDKRAT